MKISEVSIKRPVFASMIILALVVFGVTSRSNIGVDLYPNVDIPIVTVTVPMPGAEPETVETEVTDVIEEAVNTISGIKSLRSESSEGLAQIFIEFELEEDVDIVAQDVRDKVAAVRADLPDDEIEPPIIEKFDVNSSPILAVALFSDKPIRELTDFADKTVKPQIEGISGVGNVRLVGDREREVRVWLRSDRLRAMELTAEDVLESLRTENLEPPGGRIETPSREMIVKMKGRIERVEDFEKLIVAYRDFAPVRLGDVAWVRDDMEDYRSFARMNGSRAVSLLVRRQSGQNLVAVATAVKEKLQQVEAELPEQYDLVIAQDLSVFVSQSVREANWELMRGGTLAVLVIMLFLRSLRGSFVAAVTIPTTIISTFAFMLAMGFTVNMMTMLALTISVGMIIDDSIVVLENTYRHMEAGTGRMEAALAGIREIGFAVIATSLAIVAVFVPVAFMDGLVGRFFYEFGLTVTFAVVTSTFIAVTLSPMLCSRVLKTTKQHGRLFYVIERAFGLLEGGYRRTLRLALSHRVITVLLAIGAFIGGLALTPFMGQEFIPLADESEFNVQVEAPIGTSIQSTSTILAEIETRVRRLPGVRDAFTTIGAGMEERVNVGTMLVRLAPKHQRDHSQAEVMALTRQAVADLAHLKISVEMVPRVSGGGFRAAPVQYNLRGPDLEGLAELSGEIQRQVAQLPGLVDVNSTYDPTKPVVNVDPIDRDKATDLGISMQDLGAAVHALIGGVKAGTFEQDGETYDVRVRLAEQDRDLPAEIEALPVKTKYGDVIDLRNVARVRETTGPVQIDRENRSRQITLMANLEGKALGTAMNEILAVESELGLPPGVTSKFTGEADMMEESFAAILFSLGLAVILIYMVLAAQFESLVHPLTIMLSLPLSIVGALGLLALTGRTLNIFSMIGMIMLMGLVTKNAILLIDYTNLLRRGGMRRDEAILTAGPVRLRPILMTAVSTIAGMLPVAMGFGEGAETRAPMGTAIVGGMVTSTLLTLVVIPVVYSLLDDVGRFVGRLLGRGDDETPDDDSQADSITLPLPEAVPDAAIEAVVG